MKNNNSICFISFFILFLFMLLNMMFMLYFLMGDIVIFLEWEILSFNSMNIVFSLLLDWMSLLFMMFVSLISSAC